MNSAVLLMLIASIASIVATVIALKSEQKNVTLKSYAQQMAQLQKQAVRFGISGIYYGLSSSIRDSKLERLIHCTGMRECIEKY